MKKAMANSSYYFQTQKSLSISITLFFFLLLISNKVNSLERVSFEFTNFEQGQKNLILQGDAIITSPSPGMLELTKEQGGGEPVFFSVGRVLYETPIHIWNNHTDTIASFHTNFTFVINAVDPTKTADGLAFFLAPLDTQPHHTDGGLLGIFPNAQSIQPIVAVEFDTFFNSEWDPNGSHIGIDVGSIKSKKTTPWIMLNQVVANVSINYDAPTTSLSVSLVYPSASTSYTLKERVDLSDVLDPWVRIGFSATSGDTTDHVESHHVLSWSFHSELPDSSFSSTKGFKNTNLLDSFLLQA